MSLTGRHALVTGGSRGIGRAIAAALTAAGAHVSILGRDETTLAAVVKSGEARSLIVADVTDEAAMAAAIRKAGTPFDLLVANAGGAESAPFLQTSDMQFRAMLDVNLFGVVHAARAVLGGMIERKFGRVVAIASTAGVKGYAYTSAYTAAKHAVVGLVRALAAETATRGVTVNAVCPGFTDTDIARESIERIVAKTGRTAEEATRDLASFNPQRRLIAPAEVANAVLWLCGDEARGITGQAIAVAGGEV